MDVKIHMSRISALKRTFLLLLALLCMLAFCGCDSVDMSEYIDLKLMEEMFDFDNLTNYVEYFVNEMTAKAPGTEEIVWLLPCEFTRVTSPFGYRTHPVTGEKGSFHAGIDLGAKKGTPIYATRDGVVEAGSGHKTRGNYVYIDHGDGFISAYYHMTNQSVGVVKTGQEVKAGDLIGYVGDTGRVTGPHLHFGIKLDGKWINPELYLDFTKEESK